MMPHPEVDIGIVGLTEAVEIGRGAFGAVYRAFQPVLDRHVAVKVFNDQIVTGPAQTAFERECHAIGRLSGYSNILTVYDAGITSFERPYLIMAYMARGSLNDSLATHGSIPWDQVVSIGIKLSRALQVAHDAKILHLDVKPENILVSDGDEPMLADFGISRMIDSSRAAWSTPAFTPAYAAPEVLNGEQPTRLVDVYSLAATLFALMAGRPASVESESDSIYVVMNRVVTGYLPDLLRPQHVPEAVCVLIERAMSTDPYQRPATAAGFGDELLVAKEPTHDYRHDPQIHDRQQSSRDGTISRPHVVRGASKYGVAMPQPMNNESASQQDVSAGTSRANALRDSAGSVDDPLSQGGQGVPTDPWSGWASGVRMTHELNIGSTFPFDLAFAGEFLYCSDTTNIQVWSIKDGRLPELLRLFGVPKARLSPSGQLAVDELGRVWSTAEERVLLNASKYLTRNRVFSSARFVGTRLLIIDGMERKRKSPTSYPTSDLALDIVNYPQMVHRFAEPNSVISSDGHRVAFCKGPGIFVEDLRTGTRRSLTDGIQDAGGARPLLFAKEGALLVGDLKDHRSVSRTLSNPRTMAVWDLETGRMVQKWDASGVVSGAQLKLSIDETRLSFLFGHPAAANVVSVDSSLSFEVGNGRVFSLAFGQTTDAIATGNVGGVVQIWKPT